MEETVLGTHPDTDSSWDVWSTSTLGSPWVKQANIRSFGLQPFKELAYSFSCPLNVFTLIQDSNHFSDVIWWELLHLSTIWTDMTTTHKHGLLMLQKKDSHRCPQLAGPAMQYLHSFPQAPEVLSCGYASLLCTLCLFLYVLLILALKYLYITHYLKYGHLQFKDLTYYPYVWFSLKSQLLKEVSKTAYNSCSSFFYIILVGLCEGIKYRQNLLSSLLDNL